LQDVPRRITDAREKRRLARRKRVAAEVVTVEFDQVEGVEEYAGIVVAVSDSLEARDLTTRSSAPMLPSRAATRWHGAATLTPSRFSTRTKLKDRGRGSANIVGVSVGRSERWRVSRRLSQNRLNR
jgi:hypothetical protein